MVTIIVVISSIYFFAENNINTLELMLETVDSLGELLIIFTDK